MSTDVLVSYALIVVPMLLVIFVTWVGGYVVVKSIRDWRASPTEKTLPGGTWQGILFVVVIDVILFAGMDVGQFLVLWTESGEKLIYLVLAFFCPWLIYKGAKVKYGGEGPESPKPPEPSASASASSVERPDSEQT